MTRSPLLAFAVAGLVTAGLLSSAATAAQAATPAYEFEIVADSVEDRFDPFNTGCASINTAGDFTYVAHVRAVDPDGTAADAITRVEVQSDGGEPVASRDFDDSAVDTRFTLRSTTARYFYMRITTASDVSGGEGVTAWTAPVWTGR
ncbi:MAG: hypothetical protein H0W95_03580 [Nocardioidaceae bacterium]|nr:hypothetical protein [Nocardioidaceae bacterium]